MDLKAFLEEYKNEVMIKETDDGEIMAPHFFHLWHDESIALRFRRADDGLVKITDCGTTRDYLECNDIELSEYAERVKPVLERYGIKDNGKFFSMEFYAEDSRRVMTYLGYFIQAISILANIDLWGKPKPKTNDGKDFPESPTNEETIRNGRK